MSPFIRPPSVTGRDRFLALGLFLWVLVIMTVTFAGLPQDLAGEAEYQATSAFARTGSMALSVTPEAEMLLALVQEGDAEAIRAVQPGLGKWEGRVFARQGLGGPLAGLPFYFLGHALGIFTPGLQAENARQSFDGVHRSEYVEHLLFTWRGALFTALTAGLVVLGCRRLGQSQGVAYLAGASYALTTFAWAHSRFGRGDTFACLCLTFALVSWLRARENYERLVRPKEWRLLLAGLALGFAVLTSTTMIPVTLVLLVAFVATVNAGCGHLSQWTVSAGLRRPPSRILTLALVCLPWIVSIVLTSLIGYHRFGDGGLAAFQPLTTDANPGRLATWILSPGAGLLWAAPVVVLTPYGIWLARGRGKSSFAWLAVVMIAVLFAFMPFDATRPLMSYGPQPLLPLLPIAGICTGFVIQRAANSRLLRLGCFVLLATGFLVQLSATFVDRMTHADLANQAVKLEWPDAAEGELFQHRLWGTGFAPAFSHWRILRHRIAGQGEVFPVRDLFALESQALVTPGYLRHQGFSHLGFVDVGWRLNAPIWPAVLGLLCLAVLGTFWTLRGLQRRS